MGCMCLNLGSMPGCHASPRFDTQLLLRWPPSVQWALLGDWSLKFQGVQQFVAAAVNLVEVDIDVTRVADSALADTILCASKSLLIIRSEVDEDNTYMPQKLPQKLQRLKVHSIPELARKQRQAKLQPRFEGCLSMVCGMDHLRILNIDCASLSLKCGACLSWLTKLSLHLRVRRGSSLDLSWLHSQQHHQLHIHLELDTCNAAISQQVMSQLSQMHISHLHLEVSQFSAASQQIWQALSCDSFHLEFGWHASPDMMHALPQCDSVILTDGRSGWIQDTVQGPLIIMWSALARPGRLHVCQRNIRAEVQVEGFAQSSLDSLAPWQLVVHAAAGIKGLPLSRPVRAPATYYLQNSAADAAGWESMSLDACHCNPVHRFYEE